MLSINPENNSERENYKLLIGSIIPRPIAFVTSMSEKGVINGAPFSYFNVVSSKPPLISLAIQRREGKKKDTAHNIIKMEEFVVHVVDDENVSQINETAANLTSEESEISLAKLTKVPSDVIAVPGIHESKIRMECLLEKVIQLGGESDKNPSCDLIIGKIVRFHIDENIYEEGKIHPKKLNAVSRLAGNDYAKIGHVFTKKRPK